MSVGGLVRSGSIIGKLFGNAVSSAVGFGAGVAMAPALGPVVRDIANHVNSQYAYVFPEPGVLAEGVAQGQVAEDDARRWASYWGVGDNAFSALIDIANVGPGMAQAFNLWRRKQTDEAGFKRALKRLGLEDEWITDLWNVREEILNPEQLAAAVHRNIVPDPGLLIGQQPGDNRNVPIFPQVPIDALAEAQGSGYDEDHLRALVGLQGLPMGSHEAAQAQFRGVITSDDYLAAIAQGNTRNEWADAIREQSRQISTAHDAVENAIRGYSDQATMNARTARHGMTPEDTNILFQNAGRPLVVHQITTALARGAHFNPEPGELTDPYEASVHESNIKPSFYEMAIANKFSYPSLFQLNALVKAGAISADTAQDWANKEGLAPEVVAALHTFWLSEEPTGTGGTGTKPKPYTYSQIHQAWRNAVFTDAQAITELETIGYTAAKAETLLNTWKASAANSTTGG
jgi:hypothetical protein